MGFSYQIWLPIDEDGDPKISDLQTQWKIRPRQNNLDACRARAERTSGRQRCNDGTGTRPLTRFALVDQSPQELAHASEIGQPGFDHIKLLFRQYARGLAVLTIFQHQQVAEEDTLRLVEAIERLLFSVADAKVLVVWCQNDQGCDQVMQSVRLALGRFTPALPASSWCIAAYDARHGVFLFQWLRGAAVDSGEQA